MNHLKYSRGFSAWTLLPWLLFFTLAFVFWWFVNERTVGATGVVEPLTQAQVAPTAPSSMADSNDNLAIAPAVELAPVASYHEAVGRASLSVVNIYTTQKISHPYANDPAFRQFLEYHGYALPENNDSTNLGSGVIVRADGYILTNAHVVDKADEIIVALSDGRKAKATVVGSDNESDLAVIKIDLANITPISLRQAPVRVGDVTLAIGNPFGVGQTVTQGIVSATGRTGIGVNTFEDFIQTDAAINPGNSGGALVDATGALIGINTMIYSRSGGSMGIGFAIPISIAKKVMNDIISTGKVSRGWLGIEVGRMISDPASLERTTGVMIAGVMPNGPAAQAGVQAGDVILQIDGVPVDDASMLIQMIAQKAPNSQVRLQVARAGATAEVVATLAERPMPNQLEARRIPSNDGQPLILPPR